MTECAENALYSKLFGQFFGPGIFIDYSVWSR